MESLYSTYLQKLSSEISILTDKSEETTDNTLKALWLAAAGTPVSVLKAEDTELTELNTQQTEMLDTLINERIKGVPLAHITGRQSFMGMEMLASGSALIPRKETEILGYTAIETLKGIQQPDLLVLDVCTGAGNIALAIASSCETCKVYAADLSPEAVELARENSKFLNKTAQLEFYCGDLLEPFKDAGLKGKINLLTCNPPYISSSKVADMPDEISEFEPGLAFDGGAFGINLLKRLITDAEVYLCHDGYLAFEVGLGQGNMIKKLVEKSALYKNIKTVNDDSGNIRVIVAQKN